MQDPQKDLRKKILGRKGEDLTVRYLKRHGYKIVSRNYVTPFGAADIIALEKGVYCFVEVKTRTLEEYGKPSEAVNGAKKSVTAISPAPSASGSARKRIAASTSHPSSAIS